MSVDDRKWRVCDLLRISHLMDHAGQILHPYMVSLPTRQSHYTLLIGEYSMHEISCRVSELSCCRQTDEPASILQRAISSVHRSLKAVFRNLIVLRNY